VGWLLLVLGFAAAVFLDPWSLSERDPAALPGSPRMRARHAQAVVLGMGFLQLITAHVLQTRPWPRRHAAFASLLSGLGALVYAGGYLLLITWQPTAWLIPLGALLNTTAFAILFIQCLRPGNSLVLQAILATFCFGMLLDALMGLFAAEPGWFLPTWLGPEDGVRLRMLRLARAAVIALSVLTLLSGELLRRGPVQRLLRWGQLALLLGATIMPLLLTAAATTFLGFKYLLGVPANAALLGTLAGAGLACGQGRWVELAGWVLIAASMIVGLGMGLYAFDGPFPDPPFLGAYSDFPRRLARLAHAYAIVLGLLAIFLGRAQNGQTQGRAWWAGLATLAGGSGSTLGVLALLVPLRLPLKALGAGPAVVTAGLLLCLAAVGRASRRDGSPAGGAA
jgi:hypothetical protein